MPKVLSEALPASSDLLSDLLGSLQFVGTVLFRAEFREPWSVITPASSQLALLLKITTEHIIPFHVVAGGGCWVELPKGERVWLNDGDAVLLPYGDSHLLAGQDTSTPVQMGQLLPRPLLNDIPLVKFGGLGATTSIICGFLKCDELLFHPILRYLPPLMHVSPDRTSSDHWLATTIRHTANEATALVPGSRSMLPRLTEVMFVEILRKYMKGLSADEAGWFAACNDPVAGAALKLLHGAPRQDWSQESLARQVGVSRTVLVERFKRFLKQPPMQYLAQWRLQLAAQQLKTSALPMKTIADDAGYQSEAAFGRAFKRHFGSPPGDWRNRQMQRR